MNQYKLEKIYFLIVYSLIFISSMILLYGVQEIVFTKIWFWKPLFLFVRTILLVLSGICIVCCLFDKTRIGYNFLIMLTVIWLFHTLTICYMCFGLNLENATPMRNFFNISILVALLYRLASVNLKMKEMIKYLENGTWT